MPTRCLHMAIDIRAYVSEQEAKVKAMDKKAIHQKKRLQKMQKVLKREYEKINHFCSKYARSILERVTLTEKLQNSSE